MTCPLCDFTYQSPAQLLRHILEVHDLNHFYLSQMCAGYNTCKECGTKLQNLQETIMHLSTCQTEKFLFQIAKKPNKRAKGHQQLLAAVCQKLAQQLKHKNSKSQNFKNDRSKKQENIEDFVEDEENEEYIRFIGDTIAANGLDVGTVDVGPIAPVDDEPKESLDPDSVALDDEFWKQLDKIDSVMRMREKIQIDDDGNSVCTVCKETFHSMSRLLQHYWEHHKDMLSEYV